MLEILGLMLFAQIAVPPPVVPSPPRLVTKATGAPRPLPKNPVDQTPVAVSSDAVPTPTERPLTLVSPRRTKEQVRVDVKKPYMRVYYWPPSPSGSVTVPASQDIAIPAGATASRPLGDLDNVNFPTNLANVVASKAQLRRVTQWLQANPKVSVNLDGYADSRGSKKHNLVLSQKRVLAVKDFLVKSGVDSRRIATQAHGAAAPVTGQNSEETFWLSRRVTIRLHKPEEVAQQTVPAIKKVDPAPAPAAPAGKVEAAKEPAVPTQQAGASVAKSEGGV